MNLGRTLLGMVCLVLGLASGAQAGASDLAAQLRIDTLLAILRDEGQAYGADLEAELFPGEGGALWQAEVARIHAPERLRPIFEAEFLGALDGTDTAPLESFYRSDLGQRVITLELSAREAMLSPEIENAAIEARDTAFDAHNPRLEAIYRLIDSADLLEPNVVGGMNTNLAFYRAMVTGGAFPYEVTEADMLADVAAQEPEIRAEMDSWLSAYLFLAYTPLSDAEVEEVIAFSASEPGRALTRALFAGFDAVFMETSRALGAAAARRIRSQEL